MTTRATIHKIFLAFFLLSITAWVTSCTSSTQEPTQQQKTQEKTTQQQKTQEKTTQQQKTQEKTTQQADQAPPPPTSNSDLSVQLTGTWDATSSQGTEVPPGTLMLTFTDDGTLLASNSVSPETNTQSPYTVLDDSQIQIIDPDGTPTVLSYSLEGDTLIVTDPQGNTAIYQRTG